MADANIKIKIDSTELVKLNQEILNSIKVSDTLDTSVKQVDNSFEDLNKTISKDVRSLKELTDKKVALEQLFETTKFGTKEYDNLEKELRKVNTQLKVIDERTSDTTFADRIEGLARFGSAAAGAFGLATVAASTFGGALGVTEEEAQAAEQSFLKIITVISSFQAISEAFSIQNKLFNSLNLSTNIFTKGLQAAKVAWAGFGTAAKVAIASTGIGLLITGIVLLIENLDSVKNAFSLVDKSREKALESSLKFINQEITNQQFLIDAASARGEATIEQERKLTSLLILEAQKRKDKIRADTFLGVNVEELAKVDQEILDLQKKFDLKLIKDNSDTAKKIAEDTLKAKVTTLEETIALNNRLLLNDKLTFNQRLALLQSNVTNQKELNATSIKDKEKLALANAQLDKSITTVIKEESDKQKGIRLQRLRDNIEVNNLENELTTTSNTDKIKNIEENLDLEIKANEQSIDNTKLRLATNAKLTQEANKQIRDIQFENESKLLETLGISNEAVANLEKLYFNDRVKYNQEFNKQLNETFKIASDDKLKVIDREINELKAQSDLIDGVDEASLAKKKDIDKQLNDLSNQRLNIEAENTIKLIKIDNEKTVAILENAKKTANPEQAQVISDKIVAIKQKEADDIVTINSNLAKDIDTANKIALKKVEDDQKAIDAKRAEAALSIIDSSRQAATLAFEIIESFNAKQLEAIQNSLDLLDSKIEEATQRREAIQEDITSIDDQINTSRDNLSSLRDEQLNINNQIETASNTASKASLNALIQQKNDIDSRVNIEKIANAQLLVEKNKLLAKQKEEERNIKALQKTKEADLEKQKELQKEQRKLDALAAATQAALAVAVLAVKAASMDFTFGAATIAAVVGLAAGLAAVITPLLNAGFAEGGYTGDGAGIPDSSGFKVAGKVHEGEYVIPKKMVDNSKYSNVIGFLENERVNNSRGFADGGFTSATPTLNQNNNNLDLINLTKTINNIVNRPVVVSVKDINDVQSNVTSVDVLSTL
jgi:tubulin-specific chaperone A